MSRWTKFLQEHEKMGHPPDNHFEVTLPDRIVDGPFPA
jgi:hypothetical protein